MAKMFMMDPEADYLYRGTTLGWAGTRMNQFIPRTSTSTDPLVATFFGLECLFHGHAIVQIIPRVQVQAFIRPPNRVDENECYSEIEREVALEMKPLELLEYVVHFIDVDDAREILLEIGLDQVPYQISAKAVLTEDLQTTHERNYRLDADQRREFNRLAFGILT
jgi:hypothetical protein